GQEPQPVAVLGYKFWQRHFNSDPTILGRTIQLVRKNYTIVGVAAPRFTWDDGDVYLPLKVSLDPVRAYYVGLRLKPGVTHELAVRTAIGASRPRLIRQLLTESLLLSFTGAVLGVLFAYRALAIIIHLLPKYSFPHEADIQINLPVLAFSVAIAMLTGLIFGLWPALQLSRPQVSQVMQSSTRKIVGAVYGRTTHSVLTSAQVALTLLMLAGAGAAMQGFLHLLHTPLGYDPHNVMSVGIPVHDGAYPT